ncbi:uncharacterized protein LOC121732056 [Aricia agestis]|uniref:uncharacterized protein LOC121732056 n=1 Tax=Aricia agestis TaxID=91739 RepID=UPI001C209350|nr:uncharacterized protein LOC121732056 [Aricia agestis]
MMTQYQFIHIASEGVNLPCTQIEEIKKIDVWLTVDENYMLLVNHLSYVGGNKTSAILRRILEKLFSNKLAEICNWSGKNGKHKLQDHLLIKVVTEALRRHKVAETATENEIKTVVSNWFRFCKDRDGGRESRRRTIEPTSIQQ